MFSLGDKHVSAAATHRSSAGRNDQKDGEARWFALVLRALIEAGSAARF